MEELQELKAHLPEYCAAQLTKSQGRAFCCPVCGSGTHRKKTGAFSLFADGIKWKCHACGSSGDLFDLIGIIEDIADTAGQIGRARELYGHTYTHTKGGYTMGKKWHTEGDTEKEATQEPADYTLFFKTAAANLKNTDYLERRGISYATGQRFGLGYVENWAHPKAPHAPTTPRLIIPTGKQSYFARDTRPPEELTDTEREYTHSNAGKVLLFNPDAMRDARTPVFIAESYLDALSIIEAGAEAVGLGGAGNAGKVGKYLRETGTHPHKPLIIALDNDAAGDEATGKITKDLDALGIPYTVRNIAGDHKDENEALTADPEKFKTEVCAAQNEARAEQLDTYRAECCAGEELGDFLQDIKDGTNRPPEIPTGIHELDRVLDGGICEGLTILGAISSLGKTSFVLQIADNAARAGRSVLFFSLEMGRRELMAKTLSRITAENTIDTPQGLTLAKDTRGIVRGKLWAGYTPQERAEIEKAATAYRDFADNVYIIEGGERMTAADIRTATERHIDATGEPPLVIVDYLQNITPADVRDTERRATDNNVKALRQLARDCHTAVILISSFNRDNYNTPATMAAFKESGGIEYSADCLIGLQFEGVGKPDFDVDKAKTASPRKIEIKVLKQRDGAPVATIPLDYYAKYNLFREREEWEELTPDNAPPFINPGALGKEPEQLTAAGVATWTEL